MIHSDGEEKLTLCAKRNVHNADVGLVRGRDPPVGLLLAEARDAGDGLHVQLVPEGREGGEVKVEDLLVLGPGHQDADVVDGHDVDLREDDSGRKRWNCDAGVQTGMGDAPQGHTYNPKRRQLNALPRDTMSRGRELKTPSYRHHCWPKLSLALRAAIGLTGQAGRSPQTERRDARGQTCEETVRRPG